MSPTINGICSRLTYYWRPLASPFAFLPTRLRGLGAFLAVCSVLATFTFFNFLPYDAIDDRIACSLHDEIFRRPSPSLVGLHSREDGSLSLDEAMRMIEATSGLFARDYSLGLGWNNMRYIIESAALQANILNRTLVIPSFIYARSCEYDMSICGDYFDMVNRNDAIGSSEWRNLPPAQQMAFRIPISTMLNITLLRQTQPVIILSDYLRLHGLTPESEQSNGVWHRELYHSRTNLITGKKPTLFVMRNKWYDPSGTLRVDVLPHAIRERGNWTFGVGDDVTGPIGRWKETRDDSVVAKCLDSAARDRGRGWLEWNEARRAVQGCEPSIALVEDENLSDQTLERFVMNNGWEVVHTYRGLNNHEFAKAVVEPMQTVAPRSTLRSFKDEYGHITDDVLIIEGEIHLERKPGSLLFTTSRARDAYTSMVLDHVRPPDNVYALAEVLDARMRDVNEGRVWMGAHMRRGDFLRIGWAPSSIEHHVQRVKEHLDSGRKTLNDLIRGGSDFLQMYDIPVIDTESSIPAPAPAQSPRENDRFYVSTDERDRHNIDVISSSGATFLTDLLKNEDRRSFGFELMLTDVRALVEQALLARAGFVYGHGRSSFAGGMVNMRARAGKDVRTVDLD